jgi:hypothetical protein
MNITIDKRSNVENRMETMRSDNLIKIAMNQCETRSIISLKLSKIIKHLRKKLFISQYQLQKSKMKCYII